MFVQLRNGWYDRMNWIWWESLSQWLGNWDFLFFLVSECSWSRFNEDGAGAHLLFWWDQLVSTYFSHPFSLVFPQTWSELKKDYNRYIPNIIYIYIRIYIYIHITTTPPHIGPSHGLREPEISRRFCLYCWWFRNPSPPGICKNLINTNLNLNWWTPDFWTINSSLLFISRITATPRPKSFWPWFTCMKGALLLDRWLDG